MTAYDLYQRALGLMFEKSTSKDYINYYITNINQLLAETFKCNNTLRLAAGKEALTEIPQITQQTDKLSYEPKMLYEILPVGLAAKFFVDDDLNKYSVFNTRYQNMMLETERAVLTDIVDYYSGEEA